MVDSLKSIYNCQFHWQSFFDSYYVFNRGLQSLNMEKECASYLERVRGRFDVNWAEFSVLEWSSEDFQESRLPGASTSNFEDDAPDEDVGAAYPGEN
jgi:hypothetical protein